MEFPDYWLRRPAMDIDDQARSAFDKLLTRVRSAGTNTPIQYTLTQPKWQFLCHIADHHDIALHGTGDPTIQVFEPRQPVDLHAFGSQKAVYAAGDGLWAMFFAVVDRDRYRMLINNACVRVADATGQVREPRYLFSISQTALGQHPWRTGTVYLLPSDTFAAQPPEPLGPCTLHVPQLASLESVTPMARLEVAPSDFPFLAHIRGHEDARFQEYVLAMQTGGPWPDGPTLKEDL
jgi:hypothetical protein